MNTSLLLRRHSCDPSCILTALGTGLGSFYPEPHGGSYCCHGSLTLCSLSHAGPSAKSSAKTPTLHFDKGAQPASSSPHLFPVFVHRSFHCVTGSVDFLGTTQAVSSMINLGIPQAECPQIQLAVPKH